MRMAIRNRITPPPMRSATSDNCKAFRKWRPKAYEQQQDAEGDHTLAHHDFPAPPAGTRFQGIDEQGNVAERVSDEQEQDKSLEEILCHGGVIKGQHTRCQDAVR